ncbi:GNAT family N-acetyltransferase [Methylobacterium sp. WL69]|nr:GNAT family N-acetyltransferase [Methylobacterium sp. WL69]
MTWRRSGPCAWMMASLGTRRRSVGRGRWTGQPLARFSAPLDGQAVFGAWRRRTNCRDRRTLRVRGAPAPTQGHALGSVREAGRGAGLGSALLADVLAHAAECVEDVGLSVAAANHGAIRRYAAAGFMPYGLEPRALKVNNGFYDAVLMVLALSRQS